MDLSQFSDLGVEFGLLLAIVIVFGVIILCIERLLKKVVIRYAPGLGQKLQQKQPGWLVFVSTALLILFVVVVLPLSGLIISLIFTVIRELFAMLPVGTTQAEQAIQIGLKLTELGVKLFLLMVFIRVGVTAAQQLIVDTDLATDLRVMPVTKRSKTRRSPVSVATSSESHGSGLPIHTTRPPKAETVKNPFISK